MNIVSITKKLYSLDGKMVLLILEAFIYLGWARFLICFPFSQVASFLGMQTHETPNTLSQTHRRVLKDISSAIGIMSNHTFWESKCLVKAIAGMKMLERRQIASTLYLGTAKDEAGKLVAHAWLRSGSYYVTGAEVMTKFTVVGKFAKRITENDEGELMDNAARLDITLFHKELKLLLLLIKMKDDDQLHLDQKELFADIDWNLFIQLAVHHRVFPLIYLLLKKFDEELIPKNVLNSLHKKYCQNTFQMLYLSQEMEYISRYFTENQVRVLFLKGPVLGNDLYGDISLRTSVDLDVFVPLDDLDRVNKLLLNIGYEREEFFSTVLDEWKWRIHHSDYFHPRKRIKLEIHWRLSPGPGKEPGFDELWERKRRSTLTDYPVYYLEREDLFMYLATHGARHGWSRLGWLADIDKIIRQKLDLDRLSKLLKKYQRLHIGGQALILSSQLLATPVIDEMKTLKVGKRSGRLAQDALFYIKQMVNLHTNPVPEDVARYHRHHLFALMSSQQKFLFVMNFFYPYSMDAETLPLPKYLHFLYVPLRPVLWVWRKTRKLK